MGGFAFLHTPQQASGAWPKKRLSPNVSISGVGNCLAWAFNVLFISLLGITASPRRQRKVSIWGMDGAGGTDHDTAGDNQSSAPREA